MRLFNAFHLSQIVVIPFYSNIPRYNLHFYITDRLQNVHTLLTEICKPIVFNDESLACRSPCAAPGVAGESPHKHDTVIITS